MNLDLLYWAVDCGLRVADGVGLLDRIHAASNPVVLMYHGILRQKHSKIGCQAVDRGGFARQMRYLKRRFHIVHPDEIHHGIGPISSNGKRPVVLTFDDGFASNATIARPILEELQIPAVFFVSTRHVEPGRYLWFAHARALFSLWRGREIKLLGWTWELSSSSARHRALRHFGAEARKVAVEEVYGALSQYPVEDFVPSETIEDELRGMTEAELASIAEGDLFVIGAHTCNHPFLTKCSQMQMEKEIFFAKRKLEQICGRLVTLFAYPDGDYDSAVATKVRQAGFRLAFAVDPHGEITDSEMAIPRVGLYRAGIGILSAKISGILS